MVSTRKLFDSDAVPVTAISLFMPLSSIDEHTQSRAGADDAAYSDLATVSFDCQIDQLKPANRL